MKVEVKELRQGNILQGQHGIVIVDFFNDTLRNALEYYCIPISLTEEWLLKLGFIKEVDESRFKLPPTYRLNSFFFYKEDFYISDCDECGFSLQIQYVHQLQNLYFALTGEELTIKL